MRAAVVTDYEGGLVSKDRNKLFHNTRTGEVVLAGTDNVAGKVTRNRDGSFTAHVFGRGSQRCATEAGAVTHVVQSSRG